MADASVNALRRLVARLGPYQGPTASGFLNFRHQRCGDTKFRLGVKLSTRVVKCFRCGYRADLDSLVPGLPRRLRVAQKAAPRGAFVGEEPASLPWRAIRAEGQPTYLEGKAIAYLESRGVWRAWAASLGLGYGTATPYINTVIHPWYRDDGSLGGWQARKTYDPEDGSPKIVHALPRFWPRLYSPARGGMIGFDLLPENSPVLLVEGPYDTYSGMRVVPTVGIMGSEIYLAQIRRLQRKRPTKIIYGLDPDTFLGRWLPEERRREEPKARENLRRLALAFDVPLLVLSYPDDFDGDIGGRADRRPHSRKTIARLVSDAAPYDPTL